MQDQTAYYLADVLHGLTDAINQLSHKIESNMLSEEPSEDPHPHQQDCIVCGERIPSHHACIVIPIDCYCEYAHITCKGGLDKVLEEKEQE